ncbi:hypothetical protein AAZX31_16G083700 [Glycine max]
MIAHMGKARAAVEELRRFLVADSLEEVNRKLDKFYMVLILRSLHSDFDHVRDQVLAGDQVPSMDSLITRLLRVPHALKDENLTDAMETSAMVTPCGRGGGRNSRGGHNGRSGRPQCTYCKRMGHTQENCYSLHDFPDKVAQVSKSEKFESKFSDEEYQEYLKLKSEKSSNQASSSSIPCFSTACVSQSIGSPSPWILDSGASDHISGNKSSFSSIFFSKIPHLVTVANGSKVTSQESGQVSLSPSLKLNSVLFVSQCPYNLISLSQLTRSLNCSVTFTVNSFVIQEHGTGRLIGEGHESRGLYYLESNSLISCFASSKPKL